MEKEKKYRKMNTMDLINEIQFDTSILTLECLDTIIDTYMDRYNLGIKGEESMDEIAYNPNELYKLLILIKYSINNATDFISSL